MKYLLLFIHIFLFLLTSCSSYRIKKVDNTYITWKKNPPIALPYYLFVDINNDGEADMLERNGAAESDLSYFRIIYFKKELRDYNEDLEYKFPLRQWKVLRSTIDIYTDTTLTTHERTLVTQFTNEKIRMATLRNDHRREFQYYKPLL